MACKNGDSCRVRTLFIGAEMMDGRMQFAHGEQELRPLERGGVQVQRNCSWV